MVRPYLFRPCPSLSPFLTVPVSSLFRPCFVPVSSPDRPKGRKDENPMYRVSSLSFAVSSVDRRRGGGQP